MTTIPERKYQPKALIDTVFGVVLFVSITFILQPKPDAIFDVTDLPEFYAGARLFLEGRTSDIYNVDSFFAVQKSLFPALGARGIPLYVAPFGLPFLLPLLIFPAAHAYLLCKIIFCAFVLVSLNIFTSACSLSSRWYMWLCAVLPFWGPVWEALRIEQVSAFLLLSLALHIFYLRREKPVSAALALLPFLLKPHLALCLCAFHLFSGRFKLTLVFALSACAFVLGTWLYCGQESYRAYFNLLDYSMRDMTWMAPSATPTLRGQLLRTTLPPAAVTSFCSIFFAFIIALTGAASLYARRKNIDASTTAVLLAVPLGLVFSLHCYAYDLILLLPGVVWIAASLAAAKPWRENMPRLLASLPLLFLPLLGFTLPFYALIHYFLTMRGSLVNYHFVLLLVLTGYLVANSRRGQTAGQS